MDTVEKEKARESVRNTYGKVATAGVSAAGLGQGASCCSPANGSLEGASVPSCGCGDPGLSAKRLSVSMGYSEEDLNRVPEEEARKDENVTDVSKMNSLKMWKVF